MRKVVIINAGERMSLSAEKGSYDSMVGSLKNIIDRIKQTSDEKIEVEVLDSIDSGELGHTELDTDVLILIFVTAGMLRKAREIKARFPRIRVIVLTGLIPDDEVTLISKRCISSDLVKSLIFESI